MPKLLELFGSTQEKDIILSLGVYHNICTLLSTIGKLSLILLMASYYAFDLEYPKIYSQALGFFQQFMIGDKFCGKMSSRYSQFTTKYVSVSKEV